MGLSGQRGGRVRLGRAWFISFFFFSVVHLLSCIYEGRFVFLAVIDGIPLVFAESGK